MRKRVVKVHRWLSVIAVTFWFLQALTGVFAVFHWEIDDAMVAGPHRPTNLRAIERRLEELASRAGGVGVDSIWTTAGARDRYDVNLPGRVVRIDGEGNVLRVRPDDEPFADGGFVDTLISFHHDFLGDEKGRVVVGVSGLLLLTNLIMGIVAAWPRGGPGWGVLRPLGSGSRSAVLYSWHRAAGLWISIPAICLVAAGVMLAFEETTERLLGAAVATPADSRSATSSRRIGMAEAAGSALARFPGASVSGIDFPSPEGAVWRITLKQRDEPRRAYGKTRVFVSAVDGTVLAVFDALHASPGARAFNSLFAFHTGEMGGAAGRVVVLLTGLTLIGLMALGVSLWWRRRAPGVSPAKK